MDLLYTTNRLNLRTLQVKDADKVLTFYNRNKNHFEPWESKRPFNFYTLSYQRASLLIEDELMKKNSLLRFWVFLRGNSDVIIGTVNFYNIIRGSYSCCQIGYKLDSRYMNMGYAHEAIKHSMEVLKEEYNLHRIEAKIMPTNLSSIKLIERLGFKYEGLSHSSIKINGHWEDHLSYAYIFN